MTLLLKQRRMSQPQYACGVDWGNPLTRGLVFANLPGHAFDAVSVRPVGVNTASSLGSSYVNFTYGKGYTLGSGARLGSLLNSTIFAVASSTDTGTPAGGQAIYAERAASGTDIYKLGVSSGGKAQFVIRDDSSVLTVYNSTKPGSVKDGATHCIAGVRAGDSLAVYDNVYSDSTTYAGSTNLTEPAIVQSIGFDVGDHDAVWKGYIGLVAGWGRALSAAEIASLSANPWQLFSPAVS